MDVEYKALNRVSFRGKSVYCGYEYNSAAKTFFELEPEASHAEPLVWTLVLVPNTTLVELESKVWRQSPEEGAAPPLTRLQRLRGLFTRLRMRLQRLTWREEPA